MIKEIEENSEIMTIFNKYKDIFNKLIDSLDIKFPDESKLIDKKLYNAFSFESNSIKLSKDYCLDKNDLDRLL